jgi:paraquat-inducible protein B
MSQKANPATIGLFIVTGVALGVAGVIVFSSFKFFSHTIDCIAYFNESLNGLDEGAPVKFRGVTIGSVKRVMVHFSQATNDYAMPVIIQVDEKLIKERLGEPIEIFTAHALEERIKRGLRASLQTESLVTGVLYVDMRPNPEAEPPVFHQLGNRYPEIPTEPTQIQQLFNNLASIDIKGIETNLNGLLLQLGTSLGGLRMGEINRGITNVLFSVDRLVSSPLLTNGLVSIGRTMDEYRLVGEKINRRLDPALDSLTNSLNEANLALVQLRGSMENLRTLLAPDAPLRNGLDLALAQLAAAGQSISTLAEFLNQHPNALIVGRAKPENKP